MVAGVKPKYTDAPTSIGPTALKASWWLILRLTSAFVQTLRMSPLSLLQQLALPGSEQRAKLGLPRHDGRGLRDPREH